MASDSESERSASQVNSGATRNHRERNLTIKFLVNSKEAGGIIGKGGQNVKQYRDESGARINISDGTPMERVVVVGGTTSQIKKAFELIAMKFEEDLSNGHEEANVTFKLVLPNSNCGPLIGKSGANIKELRELTGATIQVANEMLPNSTERNVTLGGSIDSVLKALDKICSITLEDFRTYAKSMRLVNSFTPNYALWRRTHSTKPKGPLIPYQPGMLGYPSSNAGALSGFNSLSLNDRSNSGAMYSGNSYGGSYARSNSGGGGGRNHYSSGGSAGYGGSYGSSYNDSMLRPGILGNPGGSHMSGGGAGPRVITKEIPISSDSVGSIIGRQGSRINDIRQSTGAGVRISEAEEGSNERKVIITGNAPNVRAASYIIRNMCPNPNKNKQQQQD